MTPAELMAEAQRLGDYLENDDQVPSQYKLIVILTDGNSAGVCSQADRDTTLKTLRKIIEMGQVH